MTVKKLIQSEESYVESTDLPWANVYVKEVTDYSTLYFVRQAITFTSGIMVITPCFKAFMHENTSVHKHLLEALEVFVQQPPNTLDQVLVTLGKKGKIELVTDDEVKTGRWIKTENKYVQVYKGNVGEEETAGTNPLLAGMGLRNRESAREKKGVVSESKARSKGTGGGVEPS